MTDDLEKIIVAAECQGETFEVLRDGQPVAVIIGVGTWQRMCADVGDESA